MPLHRLHLLLRAGWLYSSRLRGAPRWRRERLEAFQRAALRRLLHHAAARAPLFRDLYRGIDLQTVPLTALPPLEREAYLANFDRALTDPRLSLAGLKAHLHGPKPDRPHLGEYTVLASSGSTGHKTYFVSSWADFAVAMAAALRMALRLSPGLRLPWRHATVVGAGPADGSIRITRAAGWPGTALALPAETPLPQLVAALNRFHPHSLAAYPRVAALLAREQVAGRLHADLRVILYGGEVPPPELKDELAEAWNVPAYEIYALSELGIAAVECPHGGGMHLQEDLAIFEPDPGGLLLTNLFNRTQPLIRFRVGDLLHILPEPCRCGSALARIAGVSGRADEVLYLPRPVMPTAFRNVMLSLPGVEEYEVIARPHELVIRFTGSTLPPEVAARVAGRLRELGALPPPVRAERKDRLPGGPKRRLVRREM